MAPGLGGYIHKSLRLRVYKGRTDGLQAQESVEPGKGRTRASGLKGPSHLKPANPQFELKHVASLNQ